MDDVALTKVFSHLLDLDPHGERFDRVIRCTYDQLYDGQRTGRYRWEQLFKTEKTHFGTLIEINAQREFQFLDGEILDYLIRGHEVDCKYSQSPGGWMFPPEAVNQLCLVITSSDKLSTFSVGAVRVATHLLNPGHNRDKKATLNAEGRASIRWLYRAGNLTPNLLLHISDQDRHAIMEEFAGYRKGQRRVDELFRRVQGALITRTVIATVAQQDDYMKRVRGNGGSRTRLRPEGIVILGDYKSHLAVARALDLPCPRGGSFVSARLVETNENEVETVLLQGRHWRIADEADPAELAPLLPKTQRL
ncbi:MAG: NaeI family type II restriction endonuclease [Gammaproteobacteria bacterium]